MGLGVLITVTMAYVCQLATDLGSNIWLSEWSQDADHLEQNQTLDPHLIQVRIGVYGGIGAALSKHFIEFFI